MKNEKQTYKYCKERSIISNQIDEYQLTQEEYYKIYSFYVTYSMCGSQSGKKRSFTDYGWESGRIKSTILGEALCSILDLYNKASFVFTDQDDLANQFDALDLTDGELKSVVHERAVVGKTPGENYFMKLFYRIRDGFAHGCFLLRFASTGEKMVIIQDRSQHNVTARMVLKLSTLLQFVEVIDVNSIICTPNKSN